VPVSLTVLTASSTKPLLVRYGWELLPSTGESWNSTRQGHLLPIPYYIPVKHWKNNIVIINNILMGKKPAVNNNARPGQ